MLKVSDGRVSGEIPLTYHRSLPSAKQLESDRANRPREEASNQGERAAEATCSTMIPHFTTVFAAKAVLTTKTTSGKASPCTVAANSVELDIEDMVVEEEEIRVRKPALLQDQPRTIILAMVRPLFLHKVLKVPRVYNLWKWATSEGLLPFKSYPLLI